MISWQTRTLAQYIAATVEVAKNQENTLLNSAATIALDPSEIAELAAAKKAEADVPAEDKNKVGSFERFMHQFGRGGVRPG